jgi:2-hydroxychromene-2-carboxylate isomerase
VTRVSEKKVSWLFDVISPFSYLALKQLHRLPAGVTVEYVPILFGGLLNHHGQLGNAEIEPKRRFTYRFCLWKAHTLGIPMRMPPAHPFNPLLALRLIVAAGSRREAVEAVFDAAFLHGRDVARPEVIEELAGRLGIPAPEERLADPRVKEELRKNTEWAISLGAFGVPTLVVDNELFWGHDALDMGVDFIRDAGLFRTPAMQAIEELPVGITRRQPGKPSPAQTR